MTGADALDIARDSIWVLLIVAAPAMLTALAVGTIVGILQALTQIQEATIVFVPKIVAVFLVVLLLLPFMAQQLGGYMNDMFARIGTY